MSNEKFFKKFIFGMLVFIAVNYIIFNQFGKNFSGDLGRLGKIYFSKEYETIYTLSYPKDKNIEEIEKEQNVDIITIGDSFSQQPKGYQFFLSKSKKVKNISRYDKFEPEQTAIILLNSGYFDKIKPKYLILESVERFFIQRNLKLDFDLRTSEEKITDFYLRKNEKKIKQNIKEDIKFINIGNFKFLLNNILYRFDDNAYFSKVYTADLSKELFSFSNKKLYFYEEDLKNMVYITEANLSIVNNNLNILHKKFKEKGIELIIMIPPNKYTLYYDFIENKKYKKSDFFELFSQYSKQYKYINTKEVLLEKLRKGETDIFLLNDTHWGIKASEVIGNEILRLVSN